VQFGLSGLLATVLIGVLAVAATRQIGTREAIRDAKQVTRLAGEGIVAPHVTRGVLVGRPGALRQLDAIVRTRVLRDGVVRVKLWTPGGRIVYSDEPRLIGARFPRAASEAGELRGREVKAQVSELDDPENRFERRAGELLEVYLPIRGPGGDPLRFEAYQRLGSVSAGGERLWLAFAPALLGGLLLLQLVNLPLARSLARRALDASQTERRAIAADLHDGVVQDLVGVSYGLAAQAARLEDADPAAAAELREGAARTRQSVRALRTLLVDIYPPDLRRAGLGPALDDLAAAYTGRGLPTTVDAPANGELDDATERLLFRVAQETLRNAHAHAGAETATVGLHADPGRVTLEVADDGRGFDPAAVEAAPADGHLGLRALRDLVADAGGRLDVLSTPGLGTTVRVEVPR
jgi:signal transduction histidine kinase